MSTCAAVMTAFGPAEESGAEFRPDRSRTRPPGDRCSARGSSTCWAPGTLLSAPITISGFDAGEPPPKAATIWPCDEGASEPCEKKAPSGRAARFVGPAILRVVKPAVTARKMSNPGHVLGRAAAVGLGHEARQRQRILVGIGHRLLRGYLRELLTGSRRRSRAARRRRCLSVPSGLSQELAERYAPVTVRSLRLRSCRNKTDRRAGALVDGPCALARQLSPIVLEQSRKVFVRLRMPDQEAGIAVGTGLLPRSSSVSRALQSRRSMTMPLVWHLSK